MQIIMVVPCNREKDSVTTETKSLERRINENEWDIKKEKDRVSQGASVFSSCDLNKIKPFMRILNEIFYETLMHFEQMAQMCVMMVFFTFFVASS